MLKRIILSFILGLNLFIFGGCSNNDAILNDNTSTPLEGIAESASFSLSLLEDDRIVYHAQQGKLIDEDTVGSVAVYTGIVEKSEVCTDVYLEAKVGGKTLTYELGCWDYHVLCYGGGLFLVDLNGDGVDEIILFMEVTGNGGALAQVFTIQKDEISLLYDLNNVNLGLNTIYQDGFKMLLEKMTVGFSETIDISREYGPEHFDKNGQFTGTSQIFLSSVNWGFVEPATGDELPKVSCKRYVYLTNYLGELQTVFQYNPETESLALVSMDFKKTGDDSAS